MCKLQIEKQGALDFLLPQVRRCHHITKIEEKWLLFVHGVNFFFFFFFQVSLTIRLTVKLTFFRVLYQKDDLNFDIIQNRNCIVGSLVDDCFSKHDFQENCIQNAFKASKIRFYQLNFQKWQFSKHTLKETCNSCFCIFLCIPFPLHLPLPQKKKSNTSSACVHYSSSDNSKN